MHAEAPQSAPAPIHARSEQARRGLLFAAVLAMSVLAGCASRVTQAPVTDLSGGTGNTTASGQTYVVAPGDTLYKIAQKHNMDVPTLMSINNISNPNQLDIGQVLHLDGEAGAPPPSARAGAPATPVAVTPVTPVVVETAPRASDAAAIQWGWPASGRVLQSFNSNTKGIDIAGAIGDPVVAAASGKVMYAGNGVRGLGNLVLVSHSDGFITAYAHNDVLLVKSGQTVSKGAKIATIGQTDTTSPQLHFEIRRRGTPVNPLSYLPAR